MTSALMPIYKRLPVSFVDGAGCWLQDKHGNQYIDALSGIAVTSLGHQHPAVVQAIIEQAHKVLHVSNIFHIEEQENLARELTALAQMDNVCFVNSGAEANEAALKLARLYGHQRGIDVPQIIVMENGFHGRTLATLSASGKRQIQAGFEPLVSGFVRAPYNDIPAIRTIAQNSKNIVAVMLEPIQGNAGVIIPDADYLMQLRQICNAHNWLLILDEIQTGLCRTGKFYAFQHEDLLPDILTSAKALGNGIPIGACMARGRAAELFQPGKHGTTFGGNPFACYVAQAVIKTMRTENIAENARRMGDYLLKQLRERLSGVDQVVAIRGKGLLLAIELDRPCNNIYSIGLEKRIIFSVAAEKVIRIAPPLIISQADADIIAERISQSIAAFYKDSV